MRRTKTDTAFMNARAMMLGFIICILAISVVLIAPIRSYAGEQTQNTAAMIESNGDEFDTLQAAIDAATDGDTITVLRDLNETSTVSGKELTIDLDEHTVSGEGIVGIPLLSVNGKAVVNVKNGTMRDGNGKSDYDGGKRTGGAGAIFIYDSGVNIESVSFIDNKSTMGGSLTGASIYANASTLSIDNCTFDNTTPESPADTMHAAVAGDVGSELNINNSLFTHQYRCLSLNNCGSSTIENTVFKDNKLSSTKAPHEYISVKTDTADVTTSFANCFFEDNEILLKSESSILKIEGSPANNNVIIDNCTFKNNKTQANNLSSGLSYIINVATNSTTNKASVILTDTLIANNETGSSAVKVGRGGSLVLNHSVIKNNDSKLVQQKARPQGAGIFFEGLNLEISAGSAVYNNILVTPDGDPRQSNDVYINTTQSKGVVNSVAPSEFGDFDDPEFDFSEYVWKDKKTSGFEEAPGSCTNDVFYYNIMKKSDLVVAMIGEECYESLEDAVSAAKDGDTVRIVTESPIIEVKQSITIDKNITLEIEGHAISLTSETDDIMFTVKSGSKLILKNDKSKEVKNIDSGIKTGSVVVEDGGELVIEDEMITQKITNNGSLKVNAIQDNLDITLADGKVVDLGDAYDNATHKDCKITIALSKSAIDSLNSGDAVSVKVINGSCKDFVPAVRVNGINATVQKEFQKGGIVLRGTKAVYLSSSGSDDNSGATLNNPVATFEQAAKIAKNGYTIIICGTVFIDDEQEWSLPENDCVIRDPSFTGYLVEVNDGGKLKLEDISIGGSGNLGVVAEKSLIKVNSGGTLDIHEGAVLSDNVNASTSGYRFGGAVFNDGGTVNMEGGSIERCEACYGGGICSYSGTFNMTGGTIQDNKAVFDRNFDPSGGGVMLIGGAQMIMGTPSGNKSNNPSIIGNSSEVDGGGIGLGAKLNIWDWYYDVSSGKGKGTALKMYEGTIDGNTANWCGGGIFIQNSMEAYIYGGAITNNSALAYGNVRFGGGGIYVNGLHSIDGWIYEFPVGKEVDVNELLKDPNYANVAEIEKNHVHGFLYLDSSEITDNTANYIGGALATCNVSKTIVGDMSTAIHDNHILNNGPTNAKTSSNTVDIFLSIIGMDDIAGNIPLEYRHPLAYLSNYMIGGGEYNWKHSHNGELIPTSSADNSPDLTSLYTNMKSTKAYSDVSLKDKDSEGYSDMLKAQKGAKVLISGNYSGSSGGGLGSDGIIVFGSILPKVDVSVEKKWDESTESLARPTKLKFDLYRAEGPDAEEELYKSIEVEPDENGVFAYTWMDLLKFVPNTETEYVYTVKEDLTYKAVDTEGNPLNLAELYDSSIEHAEDSSREIQRPKTDGTVETLDQTIKNFVITNSLKPETPETPEEDEEEETVLPTFEPEKEKTEEKDDNEEKEEETVLPSSESEKEETEERAANENEEETFLPSLESENEETEVMDAYEDEEPDKVKAEAEADADAETKEESKAEKQAEAKVKSAKTGDENSLIFFVAMMLMASAGLFGLRLSRRK